MRKLAAVTTAAVASGQALMNNPCLSEPYSGYAFCNTNNSLDVRVADIVQRLSYAEKLNFLGTNSGALPSIGLNPYNWWSEAAHGISHVEYRAPTLWASNFVTPVTNGQSFNRSLWAATGNQIGREARAFMNVGNAYSTYWAPVINL